MDLMGLERLTGILSDLATEQQNAADLLPFQKELLRAYKKYLAAPSAPLEIGLDNQTGQVAYLHDPLWFLEEKLHALVSTIKPSDWSEVELNDGLRRVKKEALKQLLETLPRFSSNEIDRAETLIKKYAEESGENPALAEAALEDGKLTVFRRDIRAFSQKIEERSYGPAVVTSEGARKAFLALEYEDKAGFDHLCQRAGLSDDKEIQEAFERSRKAAYKKLAIAFRQEMETRLQTPNVVRDLALLPETDLRDSYFRALHKADAPEEGGHVKDFLRAYHAVGDANAESRLRLLRETGDYLAGDQFDPNVRVPPQILREMLVSTLRLLRSVARRKTGSSALDQETVTLFDEAYDRFDRVIKIQNAEFPFSTPFRPQRAGKKPLEKAPDSPVVGG